MASKEEKLQQENNELRAEIEVLQTKLNSASDEKEPFRFMDLPKDIRLEIYEYLLVPGTITLHCRNRIVRQDERYENLERDGDSGHAYGETQLFLVSKQLREESLPIYLSRNLFICAPGWHSSICTLVPNHGMFSPHGCHVNFEHGGMTEMYLRRLSIAFDLRDREGHEVELHNIKDLENPDGSIWGPEDTDEARTNRVYQMMNEELEGTWFDLVVTVMQELRLEFLQMNFENCYSFDGCSRYFKEAMYGFQRLPWVYMPRLIDIRGVSRDEIRFVQFIFSELVADDAVVLRFQEGDTVIHKVKVLSKDQVIVEESMLEADGSIKT